MFRLSKRMLISFVLGLALLVISPQSVPTFAQSTLPACAATPNQLGGQGFSFSGQGFSFSGQGFSFSGQGFSFSGQGFSFSGQGLDPQQVAEEIFNNQITADWFVDLLPGLTSGLGYGDADAAIVIVDDQDHGADVLASLNILRNDPRIAAFMDGIMVSFVDIGTPAINYEADAIAVAIADEVTRLQGEGKEHIFINLSFGFVPCEDPAIGFNFNNFVQEQARREAPQAVRPVLECVVEVYEGTFIARFGYLNENDETVRIPVGGDNKLTPSDNNDLLPELFEPGRQVAVFEIPFSGGNLVWTLQGPDGSRRTSTASPNSKRCSSGEDDPYDGESDEEVLSESISVVLECVANEGEQFIARFGYFNRNSSTAYIPVGEYNRFTGEPDRGQPEYFLPGRRVGVFEVPFSGDNLVWTLRSPNGSQRTATASSNSAPCLDDDGFGLGDYLNENLGIAPEQVLPTLVNFVSNVEDTSDLSALRELLRSFLLDSFNSNNTQTVITAASSGNYFPWLGGTPLVPARWKETIAVGATLGNNGPQWQFSQNSNIRAPGAGYRIADDLIVSGTSFSTPGVVLALAQFGKYPAACQVQNVGGMLFPPLVNTNLTNTPLSVGAASPLACQINRAPTAQDDGPFTVIRGDTLNVAAADGLLINDSDPELQALTASLETAAQFGTVTVNPDGSFTYEHDGSATFTDRFVYKIADTGNPTGTDTAIVTLNIEEPDVPEIAVIDFTLINADTNAPVDGFDPIPSDGVVEIDIARIGTENLNVRANVVGEVGSVAFEINDRLFNTENVAPYALQGDSDGDFNEWGYELDVLNVIRATPFTEGNRRGEAGTSATVSIKIVDTTEPGTAPEVDPIADQDDDNGTTITPIQVNATDDSDNLSYTDDGSLPPGLLIDRVSGEISGTINAPITEDTTYPVSIAVIDPEGNRGTTSFNWTVRIVDAPPPPPEIAVTGFTLINADSNQPVSGFDPIANGGSLVEIDIATIGTANLNLRANVSGPATSVAFDLNGLSTFGPENAAPFALAGDNGGDYNAWPYELGTEYTLIGTPYTEAAAQGAAGTSATVTFVIVDSSAADPVSDPEAVSPETASTDG